MRRDSRHAMTWGLPGGKILPEESILNALERECNEEMGNSLILNKIYPVEQFTSPDNRFTYHTFVCAVPKEFTPALNHEHHGYAWIDHGVWPRPMHPGLWSTVNIKDVMAKVAVLRESIHISQCETNLR